MFLSKWVSVCVCALAFVCVCVVGAAVVQRAWMAPVRLLINEALCPSIPQPVTQRGCINLHRPLVRSGPVQDTHQCVSVRLCIWCMSVSVQTLAACFSACISACTCVRLNAMCVFECMCEPAWVEEAKQEEGGVWSEGVGSSNIRLDKSTRARSQGQSASNQKTLKYWKCLELIFGSSIVDICKIY